MENRSQANFPAQNDCDTVNRLRINHRAATNESLDSDMLLSRELHRVSQVFPLFPVRRKSTYIRHACFLHERQ